MCESALNASNRHSTCPLAWISILLLLVVVAAEVWVGKKAVEIKTLAPKTVKGV